MQPVTDQRYKNCPACAEQILVDARKCRFCGETLDATPTTSLCCSQCQGTDVQSLPGLTSAGTSTGVSASLGALVGEVGDDSGFGVSTTVGVSTKQTALAGLLSGPPKPLLRRSGFTVTGYLIVLFSFFSPMFVIAYWAGTDANDTDWTTMPIVAGTMVAVAIVFFVAGASGRTARLSDYRRRLLHWEKRVAVWRSLFYCRRCHLVFKPGTNSMTPPEDLHGFVAALVGQQR